MKEFNIGDRVVSVVDHPDGNHSICIGSTGVVCGFENGRIGVDWEHDVDGHTCDYRCPDSYGWWVSVKDIELDSNSDEPFEFDEDEFNRLILCAADGG